jgi:tRNA (guanine-N7-)-methyltransferase
MVANNKPQHIRSFIKRERQLTGKRLAAYTELNPDYIIKDVKQIIDLPKIFKHKQVKPVILEIGFGNGEVLLHNALAFPGYDFLGIEVYLTGIATLLESIKQHHPQPNNIRIYNHDAVEVIKHCIPDKSLAGIFIFFPDPWPKRRQHKRRLIQIPFAKLLLEKLKPGGILHIATDCEDYAQHSQKIIEQIPEFMKSDQMNTKDCTLEKIPPRPKSKFEQRGIRLGNKIWDLLWSRSTKRI